MTNISHKFFWASDYGNTSGEGRLAQMFIKYKEKQYNCKFLRINNPKNFILDHKYISPFVGIICCWYFFCKKMKFTTLTIYLFGIFLYLFFYLLKPNWVQLQGELTIHLIN